MNVAAPRLEKNAEGMNQRRAQLQRTLLPKRGLHPRSHPPAPAHQVHLRWAAPHGRRCLCASRDSRICPAAGARVCGWDCVLCRPRLPGLARLLGVLGILGRLCVLCLLCAQVGCGGHQDWRCDCRRSIRALCIQAWRVGLRLPLGRLHGMLWPRGGWRRCSSCWRCGWDAVRPWRHKRQWRRRSAGLLRC